MVAAVSWKDVLRVAKSVVMRFLSEGIGEMGNTGVRRMLRHESCRGCVEDGNGTAADGRWY